MIPLDRGAVALVAELTAPARDGVEVVIGSELPAATVATGCYRAQRLADGLAPYSRFVRAEEQKWADVRTALAGWRGRASQLLTEVDAGSSS